MSSLRRQDVRSATPNVVVGQTWDWLAPTIRTVVVLDVRRDDGPDYVTVVEAGVLAKAGMNSAGLAICTNFLITTQDGSQRGVPYHLTLRRLFDQETLPEALDSLLAHDRASSANYLLGHEDGMCVDIEVEPGGVNGVHLHHPVDGIVAHANHFSTPIKHDISIATTTDSPFRQSRIESLVSGRGEGSPSDLLERAFSDHVNHPRSICAHVVRLPEHEREITSFGLIMEPRTRRMRLSDGNPCAATWRELGVGDTLVNSRPQLEEASPALRA